MYSEARKLHLIEELIKIESETVLMEVEAVINKTALLKSSKKQSAHDFLGLLSESDVSLMDAAIENGCEQINADDWK